MINFTLYFHYKSEYFKHLLVFGFLFDLPIPLFVNRKSCKLHRRCKALCIWRPVITESCNHLKPSPFYRKHRSNWLIYGEVYIAVRKGYFFHMYYGANGHSYRKIMHFYSLYLTQKFPKSLWLWSRLCFPLVFGRFSICWFTPTDASIWLGQAKTKSPGPNLCLPCGWQGSTSLSCCLLPK